MPDTPAPSPAGVVLREPLPGADPCWFRGVAAGGRSFLARKIAGLPFGDAVDAAAEPIALIERSPPGVAAPQAVVIMAGRVHVAGFKTGSNGLDFDIDPDLAATMAPDCSVDAWILYDDVGDEVLLAAGRDPAAASLRLRAVAEILDGLPNGHGALDSQALRTTAAGPVVLGAGLARLESLRRTGSDEMGPWLSVSPERCLPPGLASPAGDEFALAVLWTLARSGRPPHRADTASDLVRAKLSEPPQIDLSAAGEREVIARALSLDAAERFGSCVEFARRLEEVFAATEQSQLPTGVGADAPAQAAAEPTPAPEVLPLPDAKGNEAAAPAGEPLAAATAPPPRPAIPSPTTDPHFGTLLIQPPGGVGPEEETTTFLPAASAGGQAPPGPQPPAVPAVPPSQPNTDGGLGPTRALAPLAAAPYRPGDLILPEYRLVRLLGKGGFGEVWEAVGPGGRKVAIKVIGNLDGKQGRREWSALNTIKDIQHPNIVPIFGVWLKTPDGRLLDESEVAQVEEVLVSGKGSGILTPYAAHARVRLSSLEILVAMQLGSGTLQDELQRRREAGQQGIEPHQLIEWLKQAGAALDFMNSGSLHDGGASNAVQHCDIKPQNLLLVGGAVQVCDFGLARDPTRVRQTANNLVSIAYAAPEMVIPPNNPSPSTDQYSLAVTYYELRTGRLPYGDSLRPASEDLFALMRAKTLGELNVSLVPPVEQPPLRRALALDPKDRFGTCQDLVHALAAAVKGLESPPPPAPPLPRRRRRLVLAGLGAALLAASLVAVWIVAVWILPKPPDPDPVKKEEISVPPTPPPVPPPRQPGPLELEARRLAEIEPWDSGLVKRLLELAKEAEKIEPREEAAAERAGVFTVLETMWGKRPDLFQKTLGDGESGAEVLAELAWLLACGYGDDPPGRAVAVARRANEILPENASNIARAILLDTLACAYARAGDFPAAEREIEQAIKLATNDADLVRDFRLHLEEFRQKRPWTKWHE